MEIDPDSIQRIATRLGQLEVLIVLLFSISPLFLTFSSDFVAQLIVEALRDETRAFRLSFCLGELPCTIQ